MKKETGITLISLVVTIIVILILSGVAITNITGENGIITRAKTAREKHEEGQNQEKEQLYGVESIMGVYLGDARSILVPAPNGDKYNAGDEVSLNANGKNEKFFVLEDDGTHVKLLSKYCLTQEGTAQTDKNATYNGSNGTTQYGRVFSQTAYWPSESSYPLELQGPGAPERIGDELDPTKNAIAAAEGYGKNLSQATGKTIKGRLMTYNEANSIQKASTEGKNEAEIAQINKMKNILWGKSYDSDSPTNGFLYWWLGTAGYASNGWSVHGDDRTLNHYDYGNVYYGVRPVLEI